MIGHDKPRLGRGPAMIAAALLGSAAIGGLGWSLGRASAERTPAAVQPTERGIAANPAAPAKSREGTRAPLVKVPPQSPVDRPPPEPVGAEAISKPKTEGPEQARALVPEVPATKPDEVKPAPVKPARINLNTATAAELELLPGIGPGLAQRIIEHREKAGRFRTVAELDKVKGIGPRTIDKLRPLVSVE